MKIRFVFLAVFIFAAAGSAFGQGIRFSSQVTQKSTVLGVAGIVTVPAAPIIKFCSAPANGAPCSNLATTYTDATLTTPCAGATQIVLDGTTTCVASPDAQNNWGVWVAPNIAGYAYTVTIAGANFGPFYVLQQSTSLTGTDSGNQTISGNKTFTGNNTHSGTETFNGPLVPAGGFELSTVVNLTGQAANISATTFYTVPAASAGFYRASCYLVETQAATTSSTLGTCSVTWTDNDTNVANTITPNGNTLTGNTVGIAAPATTPALNCKASSVIQYSTAAYASVGATPMQYALHIRLEYLGP